MLKNRSSKLFFVLALMFASYATGQVPPPPPPPGLPIDGGIVMLAILGAVYGAKKLKK